MRLNRRWLNFAGGAVMLGTIGGLGVLAWGVFGTSGDEDQAVRESSPVTATPARTPEETSTPTPPAPSGSPPKHIFFTRGPELWAVDAGGSDPVLLSEEVSGGGGSYLFGTSFPASSPEGNAVAFISSDRNLWIVGAEGANLIRLSDEALPEDETYYPSNVLISGWSPDGSKIAYYVDAVASSEDPAVNKKQRSDRGFVAVDTESGQKKRLPVLPNFVGWSADSEKIIYEQQFDLGASRDWYTLDITTDVVTKLTSERIECANVHPSFTPGSESFVYACGSSGITTSSMVLADNHNTNRQLLLEGAWAELQFPIVSPDGAAFVYRHQGPLGTGGVPAFEVRLFDLAAMSDRRLVSGCAFAQAWLDPRSILLKEYASCAGDPTADLVRIDILSGARLLLASDVDPN